uniref:Uncharacterized protein n=1 Tax=Arundo donax TaxID=35708 RepID=A0A0A8XMW1_ARUDO
MFKCLSCLSSLSIGLQLLVALRPHWHHSQKLMPRY